MIAFARSVLCLLHPRLNQSRTRGSETDTGWVDMELKEGPEWPRINIVPPPPATAQPSPGPEFEHTRNIQF